MEVSGGRTEPALITKIRDKGGHGKPVRHSPRFLVLVSRYLLFRLTISSWCCIWNIWLGIETRILIGLSLVSIIIMVWPTALVIVITSVTPAVVSVSEFRFGLRIVWWWSRITYTIENLHFCST